MNGPSEKDVPENIDPEATAVLHDVPGVAPAGSGEGSAVKQALEQAEQHRSDYLRAVAELDNFRKRAQRDVENAHRYALEKFAQELLAVKDSLELAQEAGDKADVKSVLAGQEATLKLLAKAFQKFSIVEIDPRGAPFDPQQHEAMAMQDAAGAEPNSVLQVVQKGYQLNGRLLRPARVIVSRPTA